MLAAATAFAIDGVVLKFGYKKDAVQKTRIKGTIEIQGMEVTINMVNQSKVRDVTEDGTATLEENMVEGKVTFGGQEMDIPNTPGNVIVMKANGEVKEIKGDDVSEATYRVQNLMGFVLPTEAVQVGSTWNKDVTANKDTKAPAYKSTYKIVAEETIDGIATFKIDYKNFESEGSDPASMAGTMWVDKSNCALVKAAVKWANVPMPGAPAPISGNFTMERVK